MAVETYYVQLPGGYNDGSGNPVPAAPVLLFPAKDYTAVVRLRAVGGVTVGGAGDGNQLWPIPDEVEYLLVLPPNEELYACSAQGTSETTPLYSYVTVLVLEGT